MAVARVLKDMPPDYESTSIDSLRRLRPPASLRRLRPPANVKGA